MAVKEVHALRERAKELRCLYEVGTATASRIDPPHVVFERVLASIPRGWQRPVQTAARIRHLGRAYDTTGFRDRAPRLEAPIRTFDTVVGSIVVVDTESADERDTFLPEERELLTCIAGRLGEYLEWKQQELSGGRIGAGTEHFGWRARYAERLAQSMDRARFGVKQIFLHGSVESGNAGPESDVDLLIVFDGSDEQQAALRVWLEGWSLCLAEVAYQHTGTRVTGGLIDATITREPPDRHAAVYMRELSSGQPPEA